MINGDILNKLANWDLEADTGQITNESSIEETIYKQLQDYFKRFFLYSENISRISNQLNTVVQDFKNESDQIEQVAVFLKKGSEKQTLDIQKCISLVEEFTDKINGIYDKSRSIISLAYDMEKNNQSVRESVDQLVLNQGKNDEAVQDIFEVVKNLINKTQKIGEITKLINRVSSETNLLGLNAKVEAVRAGAAGKGFAVVAEEIQRLSRESTIASANISDTIASVTDEISLLEKVALKSKGIFAAQRESVSEVSSAFEKNTEFINTYISEQMNFNSAIEEIKGDEDILVNAISRIFSSVREVSATAHEISSLTYNQNNSIALLDKLEEDLSADVSKMNKHNQNIKVQKISAPKKKIAMMFDTDNPFWDPTVKDAIKAAETYNYEVNFYAPKSGGLERVKEMVGFLDEIIEKKMDGLVISPVDDDLMLQKLKQMTSLGIKIVFINSKLNNVDYISLIQTDGISAGAAAARVVMGAMGNQGEVIVNTWADMHITAIENRKTGFIEEIRKNSKIDVFETPVHSKPIGDEKNTFDTILRKYPNARFIFLTNCEWSVAFAEYSRKYNPHIQVITVDFTKEIQKAMREGLIHYAIGQRAYSWGSMSISFIDKNFNNKPVKKYIDTGTYEVNQQNMSIFNSIL